MRVVGKARLPVADPAGGPPAVLRLQGAQHAGALAVHWRSGRFLAPSANMATESGVCYKELENKIESIASDCNTLFEWSLKRSRRLFDLK